MSEENVELVRRAFKAFERRDLSEFEEFCHPDIEFDWSRRLLDPIVVRGYEGIRGFFEEVTSLFKEATFEEEEMIEFGNDLLVVSLARFRGRTSGAEVTARGAIIWTVRDGKLARFRFYQSKEDALKDLQPQADKTAAQHRQRAR
jgi:ketosteroid isomerase-like protein